jgi:hypothetical protein
VKAKRGKDKREAREAGLLPLENRSATRQNNRNDRGLGKRRHTMRLSCCLAVITAGMLAASDAARPAPTGGSKLAPLFDGKSLDSFAVRGGKAEYKLEEGVIVGKTVEGSPNTFLCPKKDYGDFELVFEVKCDPDLNSGVQVRSHVYAKDTPQPSDAKRIRKAGEVYGPQVEIAANGNAGRVWDEARHTKWLDPELNEKGSKAYKPGEWNPYRVVAQGDRIRTWVNGVPVADVRVPEKEDATGMIGLQVHSIKAGTGPYTVRWRNLQIRELSADEKVE